MAYQRKTKDEWELIGNWGFGWESILMEDSYKEIKQRLREYRENDPRAEYMIVKHRVSIN